ncbi:hypothetical protein, partial [Bacillus pumilus]|uniref:hypothetical protein n=1 Tax=Bacillus pumilus TaxID=1408 RepID=UPI001C931517
ECFGNKKRVAVGFFLCMVWMGENEVMKVGMMGLCLREERIGYMRWGYGLGLWEKGLCGLGNGVKWEVKGRELGDERGHLKGV